MTEKELLEEMDTALMKNNNSRMLIACRKMFELILDKIEDKKLPEPEITVREKKLALEVGTTKVVEKPAIRRIKNV